MKGNTTLNFPPPLSKEETHRLLREYHRTKDPDLETKIWNSNLRLIPVVIKNSRYREEMCDDMIQEACIYVRNAVRKFNPKLGVSFATYASLWIKAAAQRYVKVARARGMKCRDENPVAASLNDVNESGEEMIDLLKSDSNAAATVEEWDRARDLERLTNHLSLREFNVIKGRFWKEKTFADIGEEMNCSRERVRQIEMRALKVMSLVSKGVPPEEIRRSGKKTYRNPSRKIKQKKAA